MDNFLYDCSLINLLLLSLSCHFESLTRVCTTLFENCNLKSSPIRVLVWVTWCTKWLRYATMNVCHFASGKGVYVLYALRTHIGNDITVLTVQLATHKGSKYIQTWLELNVHSVGFNQWHCHWQCHGHGPGPCPGHGMAHAHGHGPCPWAVRIYSRFNF